MSRPAPLAARPTDARPEPRRGGLAPDIVARLAGSFEPEPIDADAARRIRHRLLCRIADDAVGRHATVRADEGCWRPLGPGLQLKVLHRDAGLLSYLLRMAPGSALPPHRHPVDEECVVIEGEVQIGAVRVGAGGFHLGRRDVPHAEVRSETGALLYLRGARPDAALLL